MRVCCCLAPTALPRSSSACSTAGAHAQPPALPIPRLPLRRQQPALNSSQLQTGWLFRPRSAGGAGWLLPVLLLLPLLLPLGFFGAQRLGVPVESYLPDQLTSSLVALRPNIQLPSFLAAPAGSGAKQAPALAAAKQAPAAAAKAAPQAPWASFAPWASSSPAKPEPPAPKAPWASVAGWASRSTPAPEPEPAPQTPWAALSAWARR